MRTAFYDEEGTRRALADFILKADRLSMDRKCREFETAFASFQQSADAILFNSGGSANLALLQALRNLGRLKAGDRVGFSCLTWSTNTMPILQMGMTPVALDVEPTTLNVMSRNLEERLREIDLQAFFATNVLGFAGDLDRIRAICAQRGILLLEDNCESLGTELPADRTGNFGLASTFSFYVAHHMSTIEGGMIATSDSELSEMLRIVRANGWDRNLSTEQQSKWRRRFSVASELQARYTFYDLGFNLRPTEITGFLGLHQFAFLSGTIQRRQEIFLRLDAAIRRNADLVALDRTHLKVVSSFAIPVVSRTPELRDAYVKRFTDAGVEIRPIIAGNMQQQPFYPKYVERLYDVPGAAFLDACGFYCGNYPELEEADLRVLERCLGR